MYKYFLLKDYKHVIFVNENQSSTNEIKFAENDNNESKNIFNVFLILQFWY